MNNTKILCVAAHILYIIICYIYYDTNSNVTSEGLKIMGLFGWGQIALSLFSWRIMTGKVFVPYAIFLVAAYLFCFGQSFLGVFDLIAENRSLFRSFSESDIYIAQIYTLMCLAAFHIGALLAYKNSNYFAVEQNREGGEYIVINKLGKFLVSISFIPFIIVNIINLVIVSIYGYGGIYEETDDIIPFGTAIGLIADYFVPGLLCILLTSEPGSKSQKRIFVIFALIILGIMYCGGRSQGVVLVAVSILYYQNYVKPISKKGWMTLCLGGIMFMYVLTAVAHLRGGSRDNYFQDIVEYQSDDDVNPAIELVSEMGSSMFPLAKTMEIVPDKEDYRYGSSYIYALTSIIPNLGFWDKHPAAVHAKLGQWLRATANMSYGPGFSLVAEAYINFGAFGFVAMLIMGFYFCKILNIDDTRGHHILTFLLAIIFTYMSLKMVRNSFILTVRVLLYYMLPIYYYVTYKLRSFK